MIDDSSPKKWKIVEIKMVAFDESNQSNILYYSLPMSDMKSIRLAMSELLDYINTRLSDAKVPI